MTFDRSAKARRWTAACTTSGSAGFTLAEMMVVMALLALLAGLAVPMVTSALHRAREAVLRENLLVTRRALDDYMADHGRYPESLNVLVTGRYLRALPLDPVLDSRERWVLVQESDEEAQAQGRLAGGIRDLHSGARGQARSGDAYADW